ncbi:MAG: hypothetical protein V1487_03525 [bacterium]
MSKPKIMHKLSPIWLVGIAGFLIFTGIFVARSRNPHSVINYIGSSSDQSVTDSAFIPTTCTKNKLRTLTFSNPCDSSSYSSATYTCHADGSTGTLGGKPKTACRTPDDWRMQAENSCPEVCVLPTSSPMPSAPPGCYYQQVQCFKAPCDPILVCPSPSPSPNRCFSLVKSLTLSSPCGIGSSQGYQSIQYRCSNGTTQPIKLNSCLAVGDIHLLLQKQCGIDCSLK